MQTWGTHLETREFGRIEVYVRSADAGYIAMPAVPLPVALAPEDGPLAMSREVAVSQLERAIERASRSDAGSQD